VPSSPPAALEAPAVEGRGEAGSANKFIKLLLKNGWPPPAGWQ